MALRGRPTGRGRWRRPSGVPVDSGGCRTPGAGRGRCSDASRSARSCRNMRPLRRPQGGRRYGRADHAAMMSAMRSAAAPSGRTSPATPGAAGSSANADTPPAAKTRRPTTCVIRLITPLEPRSIRGKWGPALSRPGSSNVKSAFREVPVPSCLLPPPRATRAPETCWSWSRRPCPMVTHPIMKDIGHPRQPIEPNSPPFGPSILGFDAGPHPPNP